MKATLQLFIFFIFLQQNEFRGQTILPQIPSDIKQKERRIVVQIRIALCFLARRRAAQSGARKMCQT